MKNNWQLKEICNQLQELLHRVDEMLKTPEDPDGSITHECCPSVSWSDGQCVICRQWPNTGTVC